ncbi:hypothetical protein RAB80_009882 [Fusarium oxysporum f. sp. vasinfectum]|uniref:Uncharacterized protein n=2 Tax=Fusarium oxysporum TaxID=5507 RepID=X0LAV2_FUSOX|nr:hypothetical protein FOVG_14851 [Fusarium oxysporum f. sp. pisi HDV247]EXM18212.1 hypothetical protein FOTG_13776 [Fusarium oxysporum f. sp. vasinfectum 25433]KAK2674898.1 hypothetical protein RAB80_009882 [Fusarium oxysporum f. sp. vasinfectum]KAK2689426.1 hypothetical protein QWA68_011890 [Fusarium oxysporum]KAK2931328.1 hypothetical protein FoTM2_008838 [Fusarium oxysporum f. sp. vasinfectum]
MSQPVEGGVDEAYLTSCCRRFRDDTYVGAIGAEKKAGLEDGLEQSEGRGGIEFMSQS